MDIVYYFRVAHEVQGMYWLTDEGLDDPNTKIVVVIVDEYMGLLSHNRGCLVLKDDVYYWATLVAYSPGGLCYEMGSEKCRALVENLQISDEHRSYE